MKLTIRDGLATVFVAAIIVPYVGYLVRDEMPFIEDPRGMAAAALVLGIAAFLTAGQISTATMVNRVELALAVVTMTIGLVALIIAETAAAEVLLAVFVAAIVVTWAFEMLHHAGYLPSGSPPAALPR